MSYQVSMEPKVIKYFASNPDTWWHWEPEGEEIVAVTRSGKTIAYFSYLKEVVDVLHDQGMPPFEALLMVMSATNFEGEKSLDEIKTLAPELYTNVQHQFLRAIVELPEPYKEGKQRIMLLQALFQDCHNILSKKDSIAIGNAIQDEGLKTELLGANDSLVGEQKSRRGFETVSKLGIGLTCVEDVLDILSKVPKVEGAVQLLDKTTGNGNADSKEEGDVLEDLMSNAETFYPAALIKRIWSATNIPNNSIQRGISFEGGLSDITNKGSFTQLLISEYANDDDMFMQRLANNEALYFDKEKPPSSNSSTRHILVDVSLKNWGVPKVIGIAYGLAFRHNPKSRIEHKVYSVGENYMELDLDTVNGVIRAQDELGKDLHCGEGLTKFLKSEYVKEGDDVVLISEESTVNNGEWQRILTQHYGKINYLIQTSHTGQTNLYKVTKNSKKHIQSYAIDLELAWRNKPVKRTRSEELLYPPLLFGYHASFKQLNECDRHKYFVSKEGDLLRSYHQTVSSNFKKNGYDKVGRGLGRSNQEMGVGKDSDGNCVVMIYDSQNKELRILNVTQENDIVVSFPEFCYSSQREILFLEDTFVCRNQEGAWKVDFDGEIDKIEEQEKVEKALEKYKTLLDNSYLSTFNLMKNVHYVFIDSKSRLFINSHRFRLSTSSSAKLKHTNGVDRAISAKLLFENVFEFPDGSRVQIDPTGMYVLKSSNDEIPVIYMTALIDQDLGLATEDCFAGSSYFRKCEKYTVFLEDVGPNKLGIVKLLAGSYKMGLQVARELVENVPTALPFTISQKGATRLVEQLIEGNAEASVLALQSGAKHQSVINVDVFATEYINPFIKCIVDYGA